MNKIGHFYTALILFIYLPRLLSEFHGCALYDVQYLLLLISTMGRMKVQRSTEFNHSVDFEKSFEKSVPEKLRCGGAYQLAYQLAISRVQLHRIFLC